MIATTAMTDTRLVKPVPMHHPKMIFYMQFDDECEGVVEGGAAEMEVEEEEAPQSGNGEEGEGSSLDGEG